MIRNRLKCHFMTHLIAVFLVFFQHFRLLFGFISPSRYAGMNCFDHMTFYCQCKLCAQIICFCLRKKIRKIVKISYSKATVKDDVTCLLLSFNCSHLHDILIKAFVVMNELNYTIRGQNFHMLVQNFAINDRSLERRNPKMREFSDSRLTFVVAFDDGFTTK